jgi:hypothetical protein
VGAGQLDGASAAVCKLSRSGLAFGTGRKEKALLTVPDSTTTTHVHCMQPLIYPHLISCDEAGFTGNDMLNPDQPHFAYASHDLPLDAARNLVADLKARHRIQMPELKAAKLLKTSRGRDLIVEALDHLEGRYLATLYEKRLSLACKLFEYIYEPVLQQNNILFYRNNLHRFVAMYIYIQLVDSPMETLVQEFEAFMRSLDPTDAPTLFGAPDDAFRDSLIAQILRFAKGYNFIIAEEARALKNSDSGKWVLELTSTAVMSHLTAWGERHDLIEVVCDESKPLRAMDDFYNLMINRPDRVRTSLMGKDRPLTWNMTKPIEFVSSQAHAGVQIADLIAGAAAAVPRTDTNPEIRPIAERVLRHLHHDCILPDFEVLDLEGDEAPVNWLVLEELAQRADAGADPLQGMELVYAAAKATLPDFSSRLTA